jgi:hypothetical protein
MRPIARYLSVLVLLAGANTAFAQAPAPARPKPATAATAPATAATPAPKVRPVRDPALYKAEVQLNSQGAAERANATARALLQVIVKLTGNPQAGNNAAIRRALGSAGDYVTNSASATAASDREGNTAVGGAPIYKTKLAVDFDPAAVDFLIAGAGLKYWTGTRPKPLLWLAIDDGSGARLVSAQQINVVRPLATRGLERGLRFLLPAGTGPETAAVGAIWKLDAAALQPLSARYRDDTQLIGKVYRSVSGWSGWWLLVQGGAEVARWPVTDADPKRVIAAGADGAANALAKRDAVYLDTGPAGLYALQVDGVRRQDDYLRLMRYLQTVSVVRRATVTRADPESVQLQLDLSVGAKGFRTLVAAGDVLQAVAAPEAPRAEGEPPQSSIPRYVLK